MLYTLSQCPRRYLSGTANSGVGIRVPFSRGTVSVPGKSFHLQTEERDAHQRVSWQEFETTLLCPQNQRKRALREVTSVLEQYGMRTEETFESGLEALVTEARRGSPKEQFEFGWLLGNGCGVVKDEKYAVEFFRLAADQGHVEANFYLATCYKWGRGVEVDRPKAAEWYEKAAALYQKAPDTKVPRGLFQLARLYALGLGVKQDMRRSVELISESSRYGHVAGLVRVGMAYKEGAGVPRDKARAMVWYKLAVKWHCCSRGGLARFKEENKSIPLLGNCLGSKKFIFRFAG